MERKTAIDGFGSAALIGFAALFAVNQVVIKLTNGGLQPVFATALRSALAIPFVLAWMRWRGVALTIAPGTAAAGLLIGLAFSVEFLCLFLALDRTTVARSSVIFYTMPLWLSLGAHLLIPGERLTPRRIGGLVLAFTGVAWAILDRSGAGGEARLSGDLLALGAALGWAAVALCARATALSQVRPEVQLLWQLAVSAPLLLLAAPAFGPFLRAPGPMHWAGLLFQASVAVALGFIGWLWLLSRYPPSGVASFSFLTPVFGVALGWGLLGEEISLSVLGALTLVAAGIVLINRPPRRSAGRP
jgi:drug/metabolite transporter (DMT)-like permease